MRGTKLSRKDNVTVNVRNGRTNDFLFKFYDGNFANIDEVFATVRHKLPNYYSERMVEVTIICEEKQSAKDYRIPSGKVR